MNYDIDRDAAMERLKEVGRKAGLWGSKPEHNPYARSPSMQKEAAQWEAGRIEGASERKRKA